MIRHFSRALAAALLLCCVPFGMAQDRETKVRSDRQKVEEQGDWFYNDLEEARAEAERTGKPLMVVLRCVP